MTTLQNFIKNISITSNEVLVHTNWGRKMVLPVKNSYITEVISTNGEFEPPLTKFLLENIKNGDVVADLGANIGYFSVLLGHLIGSQGMLYAYEANPFLYKYVVNNLLINDMYDNAHVSNRAVYSKETTIPFFICKYHTSNSSIYRHSQNYHNYFFDKIEETEVNTVVLDKQLADIDKIDLLKIDIEGAEYHAFIGMQRLINENIVKTVVFELNKLMLQQDWNPFVTLLTDLNNRGKQFFSILDDGELVPISVTQLANIGNHPHVVMK